MADTQYATPPAEQLITPPSKTTYDFNFSDFLRREYRFGLDPDRPLCKAYMQGHCPLGNRCPDKHQVSSSYNKFVFTTIRMQYIS
jgi:cleavage and polyadenylation specificity factor subunit 4